MIQFKELDHLYESVTPDDIDWVSVTTLIGSLHEPFDAEYQAPRSSRNSKSKWYKVPVADILKAWEDEQHRSAELGKWYHNKLENNLYLSGGDKVIRPVISNGIKYAPEQRLREGIYPEHMVYLPSTGVCGQSDLVIVENAIVNIEDHKTSKEITEKGFTNYEGVVKKMLVPIKHIDDCHKMHYALQLSIYMYIILRHNPMLSPGKLTINHVKFKEVTKDKYGYPIHYLDENKEPVVEGITKIELPYLRREVVAIFEWLKTNKDKIRKHG